MKLALILLQTFSLFTSLASAQSSQPQTKAIRNELPIRPEMLKLAYQPDDGETGVPCRAEFLYPDNPYDFKVRCQNRTFAVHLAITKLTRSVTPQQRYEILYWVNGEGATSWLTFQNESPLVHYQASQSIKGEPAALMLELSVATLLKRNK
jgi:hypothetical protein